MASGSFDLTTWYAKRIIGDSAANTAANALLQTGTGVTNDTWILSKTDRATDYGLKYVYDATNGHDAIVFVGDGTEKTSLELDTGKLTLGGHLYLLGVQGASNTNTTQIIFGTSSSQTAAITSATGGGIMINPTSSTTGGQVILRPAGLSQFTRSTDATGHTNATAGTLYVAGGVGIAKKLYTGSNIYAAGSLYAGNVDDTEQRVLQVRSSAGEILLFAHGTDTGQRGIWLNPHGTATEGKYVFVADKDNNITYQGDAATISGILTTYRLIATSGADAKPGSQENVALITGNVDGTHIEFDGNEILAKSNGSTASTLYLNSTAEVTADGKVKNAVWNDFAEYRNSDITEPGRVVASNGKGKLILTNERLQASARIISDTYGMAIGQSNTAKTPIGVAGRVLVIPYQDRNKYKVGDCLCAAPGGTADIMTREEIIKYPDRIIGIVDEIPDYEYWDQTITNKKSTSNMKIEVKGRIWIYIK